ncbi:MAG: signal peptide peptidase SppA [Caldimicrobium sp.]|nr:signal peptide peptidase SppA [Caldimicrobium sp.]MCX7873312.1 signal peptide peptidase SppA [Caldimicrobium sp.]MDW8093450.1 signal peptide peptidase SppA [Caldimicrobium sp.]
MKRPWLVYGLAFVGGLVVFIVMLSVFLSLLFDVKDKGLGRPKIGILEVKGIILDSETYLSSIKELKERRDIKAVVVRIDSPGGAVGPVQEIFEELKILRQSKPLVVSMGGVSASGGLYIALVGQRIFANPGTITGSIGVMIQLPNLEKLMEKIGISTEVIKSGQYKDTGSSFRKLSKEERRYLQEKVDSLHYQFIKAIAEERKIDLEKVKKIADGRIYTGEEALKLGLVDELGNLHRAIEWAQQLSKLTKVELLYFPPKRGLLSRLMEERLSIGSSFLDHLNLRAFYLYQR